MRYKFVLWRLVDVDDSALVDGGGGSNPRRQREILFLEFAQCCCIARCRIQWRDGIENLVPSYFRIDVYNSNIMNDKQCK